MSFYAVGSPATPLLEEKRRSLSFALLAYSIHPFGFHGPRFRAGFTPDDYQMDIGEINRSNVLQQWFDREETNARLYFAQAINTGNTVAPILNRYPEPDIARALWPAKYVGKRLARFVSI